MAAAPDAREVSNFFFRQLGKLRLLQDDEIPSPDAVDLVAASSRFGLVFVGSGQGFKVLHVETVLDLNGGTNEEATGCIFQEVKLAAPVTLLALSADDMTLAVAVTRDETLLLEMYDIRSFVNRDNVPKPFVGVRLPAAPGTVLKSLAWNPVRVEAFAVVLSDGSACVYHLLDNMLKIAGVLPASTSATCLCWSPKGKQLVIGKNDGILTQYKPNLQEAKVIPAPGIFAGPVSVLKVHWISTVVFAAAYVPAGNYDNVSPSLVIVSTPKGSNTIYTNYGDVCCGTGPVQQPHYWMYHQPEWGILICASSHSLETGILGSTSPDKSTWEQWLLDGTGRAELPMVKSIESYPLGMAVVTCIQKPIEISETESYPPMPIIFFLSTTGLLCPFHMINAMPQYTSIVTVKESLPANGERKRKESITESTPQSRPPGITPAVMPSAEFATARKNLSARLEETQPQNQFSTVSSNSTVPLAIPFGSPIAPSIPTGMLAPNVLVSRQADPGIAAKFPATAAASAAKNLTNHSSAAAMDSATVNKLQTRAGSGQQTVLDHQNGFSTAIEAPVRKGNQDTIPQDTYMNTIISEVAEFNQEIRLLKEKVAQCQTQVGTKEQMAFLRDTTQPLETFFANMKLTMQTLCSDINNLKTQTLESFALLEEGRSRKMQDGDARYLALLRGRGLDPITADSLTEIRRSYQYLDSQIQAIHNKLDRDWKEFRDGRKLATRQLQEQSGGVEALYHLLASNNQMINNKINAVDSLISRVKQMKLEGIPLKLNKLPSHGKPSTSVQAELSTLADSLLATRLAPSSPSESPNPPPVVPKALSTEKEDILREALSGRSVTRVRPTPIKNHSQSKLLSKLISPIILRSSAATDKQTVLHGAELQVLQGPPQGFGAAEIKKVAPAPVASSSSATVKSESPAGSVFVISLSSDRPTITAQWTPDDRADSNPNTQDIRVSEVPSSLSISQPAICPKNFSHKGKGEGFDNADIPALSVITKLPASTSAGIAPSTVGASRPEINTSATSVTVLPNVITATVVPTAAVPAFSFKLPSSVLTSQKAGASTSTPKPGVGIANSDLSSAAPPFVFKLPNSVSQNLSEPVSELAYENVTPPETPPPDPKALEEAGTISRNDSIEEKHPSDQDLNNSNVEPNLPASSPVARPATSPLATFKFVLPPDSTLTPVAESAKSTADPPVMPSGPFKFTLPAASASSGFSLPLSFKMKKDAEVTPKPAESKESDGNVTPFASPGEFKLPMGQLMSTIPTSVTPASSVDSTGNAASVSDGTGQDESSNVAVQGNKSVFVVSTSTLNGASIPVVAISSGGTAAFPAAVNTVAAVNKPEAKTELPGTTTPSTVVTSTASASGSIPVVSSSTTLAQVATTTTAASTPASPSAPETTVAQPSVFGQPTTTASASPALFAGSSSTFGQFSTADSVFGQGATTVPAFGQSPPSPFAQSGNRSVFGQQTFGSPASPFVQSGSTASPFRQAPSPAGVPPFGQTTSSSSTGLAFGQPASTSGTSVFGQSATGFNQPASAPSTGLPFGQNSAFGQSTFGQSKPLFGQTGSMPFSQTTPTSSAASIFGSSGLAMSGLGGRPSAENSNKNVFGTTSFGGSPSTGTSLFGSQGSSGFGTQLGSFTGGSFSSGSGSVAQSGFGTFQQQTPPKQGVSGGFGSSATFGTSTGFGAQKFGGSPGFGSSPSFASPFGGGFGNNQSSAFGSFSGTSVPTFGSLAGQNQAPSFGNLSQQSPTFGSLAQQSPTFGTLSTPPPQPLPAAGFGSPSFGTGLSFGSQSPTFGGQSAGGSSAFTQWRQ